jgi:multidrug efflux pump subunit AcrB
VPQPFGGKYRQIMVYVDPLKLEAHHLGVMDVVRSVNDANLILPAGDVSIGNRNYSIYANSQVETIEEINRIPLKTVEGSSVMVADVGQAQDASQIQTSVVRVDGQRSVYLPVLKQGGDANTLAVVDGIKTSLADLQDVPDQLQTEVEFDQSVFVRNAIRNLLNEGFLGLLLTGLMILVFLGSGRATLGVFLSIPLSTLATFFVLFMANGTVNTMVLGGLALVFSRLIDNSVIVLENIFRHMEQGEPPEYAAEKGGAEVALPVLAATLTTGVVFFPVTFLYGVSRFLFTAMAVTVILSLLASYLVAMTVVPLFCARFIKRVPESHSASEKNKLGWGGRFQNRFNQLFQKFLEGYERLMDRVLRAPLKVTFVVIGFAFLTLGLWPFIGTAFFPRTDPSQFVMNIKAPTGTRVERTEDLIRQVEGLVRDTVDVSDLAVIVANIGVTPGFSSMYTANSGPHTATVQVSLRQGHRVGSYEYMDRVRKRLREELPQLDVYFHTGGLVDAVLNLGLPAPIDVQISGSDLEAAHATARDIARKIRAVPGVQDVLIPQDMDYPSIELEVDRERAGRLGLTAKEVVQSIITALTSGQMIAPSYWVDHKSGVDYLLTVQYFEGTVQNLDDLRAIPIRAPGRAEPVRLDAVSRVRFGQGPTQVDHYQLRRVVNIYVSPETEDLAGVLKQVEQILDQSDIPDNLRVTVRGAVQGMRVSFKSFGLGLLLSLLLVYLILVAQFESFVDPLIILLAVPTGLAGVLITLVVTGTTLNVMSLMGVVMMAGIVVSNSILIVEFTRRRIAEGLAVRAAVVEACRVRLRPIIMTSFATLFGLIPLALKLGTGSEAYAPLARSIIGGLAVSVVLTVFLVPAVFYLVNREKRPSTPSESAVSP